MTRPRFTLRTLMILVAVAAALAWAGLGIEKLTATSGAALAIVPMVLFPAVGLAFLVYLVSTDQKQ